MKPVIPKQTHYSVILMRDDAGVSTFRLKSSTLKILLAFLLVLVLLGIGGITGGLLVGKKYLDLSARHKDMERLFAESKLQLERLSGLQTLLQASGNGTAAASRVKNEEMGVGPAPEQGQGESGSLAAAPAVGHPGNATAAAGQEPAGVPDAETDALPRISSEESPVRIAGVQARVVGQQRLRVRYELSTVDQRQQVTGRASYAFIMEDDSRREASVLDADETRFAILRMKNMDSHVQLPPGENARAAKALEVTVEVDGARRYREVFPLQR